MKRPDPATKVMSVIYAITAVFAVVVLAFVFTSGSSTIVSLLSLTTGTLAGSVLEYLATRGGHGRLVSALILLGLAIGVLIPLVSFPGEFIGFLGSRKISGSFSLGVLTGLFSTAFCNLLGLRFGGKL